MDEQKLKQRIEEKAYHLWEQDGRPEGRAEDHWEKARILVGIEDDRTSLIPVTQDRPEEADIQENLGEFPGAFTDQGDRQPVPSEKAGKAKPPLSASAKPEPRRAPAKTAPKPKRPAKSG